MLTDIPWSLVLTLGPALLLLVIVWAFMRNRAAGPRSVERAERGAAELRDEIERDADPR